LEAAQKKLNPISWDSPLREMFRTAYIFFVLPRVSFAKMFSWEFCLDDIIFLYNLANFHSFCGSSRNKSIFIKDAFAKIIFYGRR